MKTYDVDTYVLPIWKGDTVFYETAMFMGKTGECKLLYTPTKILGVYDYGLQKDVCVGVVCRMQILRIFIRLFRVSTKSPWKNPADLTM